MGAKAKKSLKKKQINTQRALALRKSKPPSDFLPLEGDSGKLISHPVLEDLKNTSTVLYIGRIPHGFYEDQMEGFFSQFGKIKRLRIARNKKTGKSKHYGFIEFENPEVAKVVADEIHGYLIREHSLQLKLISPEKIHPKLWTRLNRKYKPLNWREIERKRHNKEKTLEEHQKMVDGILKRERKRHRQISAASIDYECPDFEKTLEERKRMVEGILKRERKRHRQIEAAAVDSESPDFAGVVKAVSKRAKLQNVREV